METEAGVWIVMRRQEFEDAAYVAALYNTKLEAEAYAAGQEAEEKDGNRYWTVDGPFPVR